MQHVHGTYSSSLVLLSIVISMLASYSALSMMERVVMRQGKLRKAWIIIGSCVMGLGIWSMHFVGMLAFHPMFEVDYSPSMLIVSMILPILGAYAALQFVYRERLTRYKTVLGGFFMGTAITGMHYTGMAAMIIPAQKNYNYFIVALSFLIAVVVSFTALYLFFNYSKDSYKTKHRAKLAAGSLIGLGIASVHYIGMAAVRFTIPEEIAAELNDYSHVSQVELAVWVGIAFLFMMLSVFFFQFMERVMEHRLAKINERRYRFVFEHNPDIVLLYDKNGKILQINHSAQEITGYTIEELQSSPILELLGTQDRYKMLLKFRRAAAGKSQTGEFSIRHKHGGILYFDSTIVPLMANGEILDIYMISRNITAQIHAEMALRKEKDNAKKHLDVIGVILLVLSADRTVALINRMGSRILGYKDKDIVGKDWFELVAAEPARSGQWKVFHALINGEQTNAGEFESTIMTGTGEKRVILWHQTILIEEDGAKRVLSSGEDITERRKAEAALKKSEANLSEAQQIAKLGSWEWDLETKELSWSVGMVRIFGYDASHVSIDLAMELVHAEDRSDVRRKIEDAIQFFMQSTFEYRMIVSEGNLRYCYAEIYVKLSKRGKPLKLYGFVQDITERKRLEMQLREATQAKSQFLARMSHELRTPMNAIVGLSHLVQITELSEKQRDYMDKIQSASNSLLGLINDILDISKIEASKLELEKIPFHLERILKDVVDVIALSAAEKNLEVLLFIDWDVPEVLIGDPLRLRQVLINLVNNAVKFTEFGEIMIRIQLISLKRDQAMLQFSIKDTGIGLTPEQKSIIFQAFTQGNGTITRKYGGTGLGLAISKQLVGMMNGRIRVESSLGKGSNFLFTAEFSLYKDQNQTLLPVLLHRINVLAGVVSRAFQDMIRESLAHYAFEITCIEDRTAFVEELSQACSEGNPGYDLVLIDGQTYQSHGFQELLDAVNRSKVCGIPFITMVNCLQKNEMSIYRGFSRSSYILEKPFNNFELLTMIERVLAPDTVIQPKEAATRSPAQEVDEAIKDARILIAEDNRINQKVYQEILKQYFHHIELTDNGYEAIEKVIGSPPSYYDIVLMDIQMPELDGYEAARLIRQYDKEIPIIAISAFAQHSVKQRCMEAGMNDYIAKPIDPDRFIAILTKWIKAKQHEDGYSNRMKMEEAGERITAGLQTQGEPLIDIEALLNIFNGNQKALHDILNTFYRAHSRFVPHVSELISRKEYAAARHQLHNLKGVAGNLFMNSLYVCAQQLEKALIERNETKINSLFQQLDFLMDAVLQKISNQLTEADDASEANRFEQALNSEEIGNILEDLEDLLGRNSMEAQKQAEFLFQKLGGHVLVGRKVKEVMDLTKILDYKVARLMLQEIRDILYKL